MQKRLLMYTPDYDGIWTEIADNKWSIMHGTHVIEEINGKFYNRYGKFKGKDEELQYVADKSKAIIITREELWRLSQFSIDFFKQRKDDYIMNTYYQKLLKSREPEAMLNSFKREHAMICMVFETIYKEGMFNRRILLQHSATKGI